MNYMINKGFTLIELIVVIAIIAVLATFFINNSSSGTLRARDTSRKSDLSQYQDALEIYANKNSNAYPTTANSAVDPSTVCPALGLAGCPVDPKNGTAPYGYNYESNGSKYLLWAALESGGNYWVVCSSGLTGAKPQAGFSVSNSNCPLP